MLDIPEEGYKLPLKVVNDLYNKYFVPNHDWIDRIEFDEFTLERTEHYIPSEKRRKEKGSEELNPTLFQWGNALRVIYEKTPEKIKASGKVYTNLSKEDLVNRDSWMKSVGEKEALRFSNKIYSRPDFIKFTPLRNSHYDAFSEGEFDLKYIPKDETTITESNKTKTDALELISNKILPEIYPVITDIKIEGPMKKYIGLTVTDNFYKIKVDTTIPEDVTIENYWNSDYADMDFTYMKSHHVKDLLKYLKINPNFFHSEMEVYNINGDLIGKF